MMRQILIPACLLLASCTVPVPSAETPTRAAIAESTLPPMKNFARPQTAGPTRSNRDIARDFLDLSFMLESGRPLHTLTRFEGPISVRVTGNAPQHLTYELNRLLQRLRTEAGISIGLTQSPNANITIEAVSRKEIRRHLPQAACFVVPNISSLSQYRAARRSSRTSWAALKQRERLAIFLPHDVSPQEVRDCLHEELGQAIGPLNDLYRLSDSVFNDDNMHTVLTGFDMLILRAYYDPSLRNGMTREAVAARLPAILARINPAGERRSSYPLPGTSREWIAAVQAALGPGAGASERRRSAIRALNEAKRQGWRDHRLAFSYYALGRLLQSHDAELAQEHFLAADQIYRQTPGTDLHRAYVASQLAAYAISSGRGEQALGIVNPHLATAAQNENAALLSTLMLLRAEALDLTGQSAEARSVRLDSLGWARYGFGADWAVRAKLREIAALSPLKGRL